MAQTVIQILRCLMLGGYTARVVDGSPPGLEVQGPQPLAGPLPASIKARRDELVEFLNERAGGVWPPDPSSELRDYTLSIALNDIEAVHKWRAA